MFSSLNYNNIKGTSESLVLDRVTVITGENASGKSAACDALRLAATGRTEIGAMAAAQSKLISANQASVVAIGRGVEANWAINGAKRAHDSDKLLQASMPVTPKEFWDLSGVERLALIAPAGSLDDINSRIARLEVEQKGLKTVIAYPTPEQPPVYDGAPIDQLRASIDAVEAKLNLHQKAQVGSAALTAHKANVEAALLAKPGFVKNVEEAKAWYGRANDEHIAVSTQLAQYNEKCFREPKIIQAARTRGVSYKQAILDTANVLVAGLQWGGHQEVAKELVDLIEDKVEDGAISNDPLSWYNGVPIAAAMSAARNEQDKASQALALCTSALERCEAMISAPEPPEASGLLGLNELAGLVESQEKYRADIMRCESWNRYDQDLQAVASRRVEAQGKISVVELQLTTARSELASEVNKLKNPIETRANAYLEAAGYEPLRVSVENSGRKWQLNVSIGDIDLEAMADSKRLMYDLCLLSAIHDLSDAKSPILVAKCAEMDVRTFRSAITAMRLREKGNVVLEHHIDPKVNDTGVLTINLSKGSLVLA